MNIGVRPNGTSSGCNGHSLPATSSLPQNGEDSRTAVLHVLVEGLTERKTLGLAASADQHQIQVLPHMVEARVGVLV